MSEQDNETTVSQFTVKKRAIIYARVSGDDRKYATSGIEAQLSDCRKYAQKKNYNIIGEFFEEPEKNTSGFDWLPELKKILKLAQHNSFDVLVVRELDRLARNKFKQMSIENSLEQYDIKVEYVIGQYADTSEGKLLKGLMSEFAEFERTKIDERTTRGRRKAVAQGNVMIGGSKAPYGYDCKDIGGVRTLVVNEQEAATVRLIFDLFVNRQYTLHALADYLDDHNIPKPAKGNNHKKRTCQQNVKGWSTGTIYGILGNETYIGRWYYDKTKNVKEKLTGKRRNIPRPRNEWLLVNVSPILNGEIFEAAQKRKATNKYQKGKHRKYSYLLGGMTKCKNCNNGMSGITKVQGDNKWGYYKCNSAHFPKRYGFKCENSKMYKIKVVEDVVWGWIKSILLDENLLDQVLNEYNQIQFEEKQPITGMIEANQAKIEEFQNEKQRLIDGYAAGILSLYDIAPKKTELDKSIQNLKDAITELQADLDFNALNDDELDLIHEYAQRIRKAIDEADNDFEVKRRVLELLMVEVTLSEDDEGKWADIRCVLGNEHLAADYAKPGCNGSASRRSE
ncbi:MAG: recombinase family protein, partial [Anaerolineae bacterium]|nr:recombinase family protein [Anaerolineae bacterium]